MAVKSYDIIVIGAGLAGLSAANHDARDGVEDLVVAQELGWSAHHGA
ncbi:FAD-binding protein [Methanopyrus sp.]